MAAVTSRENALWTGFGLIRVHFKLDTARLDYEQSLLVHRAKHRRHANNHTGDWRHEMGEAPRFSCLAAPRLRTPKSEEEERLFAV